MVKFCPECGGELKIESSTKNFYCKSCGLYAPGEKLEEMRDKTESNNSNPRKKIHDDYLDWWQSSKKDKQKI